MSRHLENWLQAYFDGELAGKRKQYVETHLAECKECTHLLDELGRLSEFLSAEPETARSTDSKQFVSQVMLRLPRKNIEPWWKPVSKIAYYVIPALLFFALVFNRTTAFSNNLLVGADFLGLGGEEGSSLLVDPLFTEIASPIALPDFGFLDLESVIWNSLGSYSLFGIDITYTFVLPLLIGLLAVSWMIGWWVTQDNK